MDQLIQEMNMIDEFFNTYPALSNQGGVLIPEKR
jgi:hypothetical protein